MVFNFVGEVDSVRERQKEFISKVLEEKGFQNCDVSVEPVGKAGDNFIANVKRIVVNQHGETFKMVAKLAPELREEVIDISIMFKNEHVTYTQLFPKLRELQKNAGVPEKDWFRHAECHGTYIEVPHEVILLEDLKETKFEILNRFEPMPIQCVKLVLKNFAVSHSLSYALKYQEPETFAELTSKIINIYDASPQVVETRRQFGQKLENDVLTYLSDEKYKKVFKGTMSNLEELLNDVEKEEKGSQYSVIQHGDGWTNNIMFTFEDNRPSQCVLIDYQMVTEKSPVYDVMYMLFNSIECEQQIELYTELIDYYHNELDKSLSNYGLKVSEVYPRDRLNADMKRYIKLILAISIIVTNLIVKDVEEATKIQETMNVAKDMAKKKVVSIVDKNAKAAVLFKKRIEGLAKSVVELNLL